MIKKIFNYIVEAIKETLNLSWTLVGLIIAVLTLTGSAAQITALATLITLIIWLLTIKFRSWNKKIIVIQKKITKVLIYQFVIVNMAQTVIQTNIELNIANGLIARLSEAARL